MARKLIVDGKEIEVEDGTTLMHACEAAGAEIPRFCYHERLSIAGNCRMCLVEVEGSPKPIASCAMLVNDLPPNRDGSPKKVFTTSKVARKAREGVMEFLLLNHPLDCPICDQGGECDLQDQAMAFGLGGSRYEENKRAVEDKYIGPLIKTVMTRCIHCTRCVRYMTEIAGVEELGLIGRGEDAEITTYLEKGILTEMSANAVDLCPVGALTHRPWAHNARPWELKKTESIDVMDALGSAIRVDTRGREVMRILPRNNDAVNEEWISDKTRHVVDGLKTQRLDRPYVRRNGRLVAATWAEALDAVAQRLKSANPARIGAIAGDLAGAEEMFALREMMAGLGVVNLDCRQAGEAIDPAAGRAGYLFNATVEGIDQADAILIVGSNPRLEMPVLHSRLRRRVRQPGVSAALIGEAVDLGFHYVHLGTDPSAITKLLQSAPARAERPMILVGTGALARPDGAAILGTLAKAARQLGVVKDGWNGFSVLHTAAARVAGLDLGFVPGANGQSTLQMAAGGVDVLFNLGADEIDIAEGPFVIYQGSHGDRGAHRADVILPGAAYTEKSATYVNTEGRAQQTVRAVFSPGEAREDWTILRALSAEIGQPLPFDTLEQLRAKMYAAVPGLAALNTVSPADPRAIETLASRAGVMRDEPLRSLIKDFYMTNPIARASQVMAELSALRHQASLKTLSAAE
ncbi:MAG: NADH-quinone oxidoreductase subunit NuoG [Deltaproteobacteria bacterium]